MSHLERYLDYYRSLKAPGYAVLVTGAWGSGKTHQVLVILPKDQCYYVSLFGLTNSDEVVAAVYAAMFPKKAKVKELAAQVGEIGAEIPSIGSLAIGGLTSGLVNAFLRDEVANDKPIIFDDLERCGLGLKDTLGIINRYVEHHGCKVIVIAHDEKIADSFTEAKEKVFGQSLKVQPQSEAAFLRFQRDVPDGPGKDAAAKYKAIILEVFQSSGIASLRILKHVIEDVARLISVLDPKHVANDQAMVALVRLFAALNVEFRAGNLKVPDLGGRENAVSNFNYKRIESRMRKDSEPVLEPPIVIAQSRYRSVNLTNTILQDGVLVQILDAGQYDATAIKASLDASVHFLAPKIAPAWQTVSSFDKLEDDIVADAVARMEKGISDKKLTDPGEILHTFALKMLMASEEFGSRDVPRTLADAKTYIDGLLAAHLLPPLEPNTQLGDEFDDAAHGFKYWVTDAYVKEFDELRQYLNEARGTALKEKFPTWIPDLVKIVETNGERFWEEMCHTKIGRARFGSVPILTAIAPGDFVDAWMRSPKAGWYWIREALKTRYGLPELNTEKAWISQVRSLLKAKADAASGLPKLRIKRAIPELK